MKECQRTKIRAAYEEFSNNNKGSIMKTCVINKGVEAIVGSTGGMSVSDFAEYETSQKRSHLNKLLFRQVKYAYYEALGTPENTEN